MGYVKVYCKCGKDVSEEDHGHIECRCSGYEKFREGFEVPHLDPEPPRMDGRWKICRYCGKIRDFPDYLVTCPNCGIKFKGPRPYFPVDYECEKCE